MAAYFLLHHESREKERKLESLLLLQVHWFSYIPIIRHLRLDTADQYYFPFCGIETTSRVFLQYTSSNIQSRGKSAADRLVIFKSYTILKRFIIFISLFVILIFKAY